MASELYTNYRELLGDEAYTRHVVSKEIEPLLDIPYLIGLMRCWTVRCEGVRLLFPCIKEDGVGFVLISLADLFIIDVGLSLLLVSYEIWISELEDRRAGKAQGRIYYQHI